MSGIVIIEDDVLMRSLLHEWLAAEGYFVQSAQHESARADLVIADVHMPRHLGVERLQAARAAYPGAPIIAISGHFHSDVRCAGPAAKALGVDRVIAKPARHDAFLGVVRSLIGPPKRGHESPHDPAAG